MAAAKIEEKGKSGFIDKTGKFAVKPQWGDVRRFFDGIAAVSPDEFEDPDGRWGYIDKKGVYIWKPTK